jgi:hypothetical protein
MGNGASRLNLPASAPNGGDLPLLILDVHLERVCGKPGSAAGRCVSKFIQTVLQRGWNADRDCSCACHFGARLYTF